MYVPNVSGFEGLHTVYAFRLSSLALWLLQIFTFYRQLNDKNDNVRARAVMAMVSVCSV